MRTIEVERSRVERRRSAVVEIREHLARLYRGFVGWASLYGDGDDHDERERRERVVLLLDELSKQYLPRSVWLMEGNRKKIENFLSRAEELCSEFSTEIEERGYHRVRRSMEKRVSKKLRPLKTEAESGLEAELTEPRPGWRDRLRQRRLLRRLVSTLPPVACQHASGLAALACQQRFAFGLAFSFLGSGLALRRTTNRRLWR